MKPTILKTNGLENLEQSILKASSGSLRLSRISCFDQNKSFGVKCLSEQKRFSVYVVPNKVTVASEKPEFAYRKIRSSGTFDGIFGQPEFPCNEQSRKTQ